MDSNIIFSLISFFLSLASPLCIVLSEQKKIVVNQAIFQYIIYKCMKEKQIKERKIECWFIFHFFFLLFFQFFLKFIGCVKNRPHMSGSERERKKNKMKLKENVSNLICISEWMYMNEWIRYVFIHTTMCINMNG